MHASGYVAIDPLAGGGELGARMRAIDWSRTPLGPVDAWPLSLKTCVRIVLTSAQPMFVWWGESLINLYNDAYKSIVGGKHPEALGQPAAVVWREIWDQVGPRAEHSMLRNEGTYDEALLLVMERNGYPEETYYTFSYSPVPNDHGGTGGIICANTDDTDRIIDARRLALLRDIAARTSEARTVDGVCTAVMQCMETASRDIPFAMLYLPSGDRFELRGTVGIERGHAAAPAQLSIGDSSWSMAEAAQSKALEVVHDLGARFGELPTGAWDRRPSVGCVVPFSGARPDEPAGFLVAAINPFRPFDARFKDFMRLVAGQIESALRSVEAYEAERKRAEALAEIDRAKTAFFSNVSHEFRTPLTLMMGPTEDLLAGVHGALAPEQRTEIDVVHRNALRLQKLVNALLDFSRIEAGRVEASYQPTDLVVLTRELTGVFRSAVEKAGLRFAVSLDPLDEPVWIDRNMYEKIVFNLLSNALKFTFEGGIEVSLRDAGERVELVVRDTGVGVSPAELPRLFERFHRVQGARSRSHEGSGIGLALVQELARLHGGSVSAESTEGVGTTFVIALPKGTAHLPSERLSAPPTLASTEVRGRAYVDEALRWFDGEDETPIEASIPPLDEKAADIVVADDNADMRDYVTRLLSARHRVRSFANGRAALEAVRAERPHLVLTDVMMPELDGFGLLAALRADPSTRRVPVIMLSARAGEEAKIEGLQAGADDYLVKPFSARELVARIDTQLEVARSRAETDAERRKLHELFMNAPAAIALLRGKDHVFELANDPYCAMIGRRGIVGRRLVDVMPEIKAQGFLELLGQVMETGVHHVGREVPVQIDRDGTLTESYVTFVYTPFRDGAAAIVGVAVFAFDVTDLVVARKRAEDASRLREDFLSVASHELRTPITSLVLHTQLAHRLATKGEPGVEQRLAAIRVQAQRIETLIAGLLDVSRISAGKLELNPEDVDLAATTRDVIERLADQARATGSVVSTELAETRGHWDPMRVEQIVTNLIANAIKYGKGKPIAVSTAVVAGRARLIVRDAGIGIAEKDQQRLFGRFERLVNSRNYAGLGLGLWIVKQIVSAMNGSIELRSEPEIGTTFTVELPLEDPSDRAHA